MKVHLVPLLILVINHKAIKRTIGLSGLVQDLVHFDVKTSTVTPYFFVLTSGCFFTLAYYLLHP